MFKLRDNTEYGKLNDKENCIEQTPSFPKRDSKNYENFLKDISGKSIKDINENDGEILMWPHLLKDCNNDFANMKILEYNHKEKKIQTTNLVGFIGKGDVEIEINSRFSGKENRNEQDYFLYYILSKVFSASIVNLEVGGGSLKELDFLLFLFPRLLKSAMQQGMYKKYVKKEYNDSNIRGVININRHIRYNDPPNGRIAYTTREFSYDNDITQLIRHTIEYMSTIPMGRALLNSDKEVEQYTRQIIQVTPLYQKGERRRVITANRTPLSHPYYNRYKALQQICLAILRKEKMSHGSMSNKVHGLLIDVAWLWEEYIGIIMREEGFTHHTNKTAFKLFTRIEDCYEEGKNFQNIIPDYVWEQGDKKIIADAKYIPLHRFHKTDAERASAIYYKTIMYMYRFATNIGFLFHPCSFEEAKDYDVTFQDYEIANGKNCHLYKVGLVIPDSNKEYKDFKNEIKDREEVFKKKVLSIIQKDGIIF